MSAPSLPSPTRSIDALSPLGIRHIEMPATPERLWRALREAETKGLAWLARVPHAGATTVPGQRRRDK